MKRILLCTALAMTVLLGVSAYAADAGYTDGKIEVSGASDVYTVLIRKASTQEIYYIDQSASGSALDEALSFALKENHQGSYTLTLGHNDAGETGNASETINFSILQADIEPEVTLNPLAQEPNADDATYNAAFITNDNGIDVFGYNYLTLEHADQEGRVSVVAVKVEEALGTSISDGTAMLGIQINNIPNQFEKLKLGFCVNIPGETTGGAD